MKESVVSEKKAGSVSAQRKAGAPGPVSDEQLAADRPLMSIVQRAGCRDCGLSVQSLAGGIMQTPVAQRQAAAMSLQRARGNRFVQGMAVQAKREPNRTGMPDNLKAGIEALSGIDMSEVRVYANSDKPARLGALAYTQGDQIYLGPGQERHLAHEAWHVVQQAQGRVRATRQMRGVGVNDDIRLEIEANRISDKALQAYEITARRDAGKYVPALRHLEKRTDFPSAMQYFSWAVTVGNAITPKFYPDTRTIIYQKAEATEALQSPEARRVNTNSGERWQYLCRNCRADFGEQYAWHFKINTDLDHVTPFSKIREAATKALPRKYNYCGIPVDLSYPNDMQHVYNDLDNLRISCPGHNRSKKDDETYDVSHQMQITAVMNPPTP